VVTTRINRFNIKNSKSSLHFFISVINQLDVQNFCFTISLFHASTCFEHMCSKHVEAWDKLIVKQKFCTSSWLIAEINILRCTVSKPSKVSLHCQCIYVSYYSHKKTTAIYVSYHFHNKQPLFMFPIILAINNHYLCFLSFSQETTTIFVYNINYFIFIMEIECVYCAVRTGTSNTFHTEWSIQSVTLCMLWSDGYFFSCSQQIFLFSHLMCIGPCIILITEE
jgi:hypothetical protein